MIEDNMFQAWLEYFADEYLHFLDKQLKDLAKDSEHRKSDDPYHVGNILMVFEFTDLTNIMTYLFNKYGLEFVSYIQWTLILNKWVDNEE